MSEKRMEIIVQEIMYWKEQKLLPEQYCDYLLALYTQGNTEVEFEQKQKNSRLTPIEIIYTSIIVLMLILTVVVYLLDVDRLLQTMLFIAMLLFSTWIYILLRNSRFHYLHMMIILVLYLFASVAISINFLTNDLLYIVLGINVIVWYYLGLRRKFKALRIMSMFMTVFMVFYMIYQFFLS